MKATQKKSTKARHIVSKKSLLAVLFAMLMVVGTACSSTTTAVAAAKAKVEMPSL